MTFSSNPLSLSVPDTTFESWLRDSGYLELLDHRTSALHNHPPPPQTTTPTTTTTTTSTTTSTTTTPTFILYTLTMSLISSLTTLFSILTLNPFSKLTSLDFSHPGPTLWTRPGFLGSLDTYSFPSSPAQARLRVHENVKRFARNYAALLVLFFACSLYQLPLALVGLLSCLAVWELFRFCDQRWVLDGYPAIRQALIRTAQCAVAFILIYSNVQMAVFCSLAVSYAVMIIHASFRKLTPANQPSRGRGR